MRLSALLALWPAVAGAEPGHTWGTSSEGPCRVELARCPDADCWRVVFRNRLVFGADGTEAVTLDLDGFPVAVTVTQGPQDVPDTVSVVPPAGYVAEPAEVTVEEGEEGVIVIRAVPMM